MSPCGGSCGCGGGGGGGRPICPAVLIIVIAAAGVFLFGLWRGDGQQEGTSITHAPQEAAAPATAAPDQPDASPRDFHRFGLREARPKPEGAIRLATYNVLNLFDDVDDPALSGRNEDIDDTKPPSEREAVAAAIRAIDADILSLQEIESETALREFMGEHLVGLGYEHVASIEAGDSRGIEQAVLSRWPIVEAANWPGEPLGGIHPDEWGSGENWEAGNPILFRRSPLRVTVRITGVECVAEGDETELRVSPPYDLTLFVVHHKSGRPGAYWRAKEAARLVEKIDEVTGQNSAANIAILGDFNCVPSEEAFQTYITAGFTDVLGHSNGTTSETTTHESGRAIDHILVNANLQREIIDGSAFVYGTPARPEGSDWRTTPPPPGFASDHYPVVVDLTPIDRE